MTAKWMTAFVLLLAACGANKGGPAADAAGAGDVAAGNGGVVVDPGEMPTSCIPGSSYMFADPSGEDWPACESGDDCPGLACVMGYDHRRCAPGCETDADCPAGWGCGSRGLIIPEGAFPMACTPLYLFLGGPCADAEDCLDAFHLFPFPESLDLDDFLGTLLMLNPRHKQSLHRCLPAGEFGKWCTVSLPGQSDCITGWQSEADPLDVSRTVCVPHADTSVPGCTVHALDVGMTGECDHGKTGNVCTGQWSCGTCGLHDCGVLPTYAESCNSEDDDCDGEVDEGLEKCFGGADCPCVNVCGTGVCGQHGACNCGGCFAGQFCILGECRDFWEGTEPGQPGAFCSLDEDCQSGHCAVGPEGPFCTMECKGCWDMNGYSPTCTAECPPDLPCQAWPTLPSEHDLSLCLPPLFCLDDEACLGKLSPHQPCQQPVCEASTCILQDDCQSPCKPECNGKECGDDGCGGQCGDCGTDAVCQDGVCAGCDQGCEPFQCGAVCGGADCGSCEEGFLCDTDGLCKCDCQPQCAGKECGPDSCLGSCGACASGQACKSGQCCVPNCAGKICGEDGCGGWCGWCAPYQHCQDGGCHACTPDCDGKTCGPDGCGGSCGDCPEGLQCNVSGVCEDCCRGCGEHQGCGPDGCGFTCGECDGTSWCDYGMCTNEWDWCVPGCEGRECGMDGCGGSCGECKKNWECIWGSQGKYGRSNLSEYCVPAPTGPCLTAADCHLDVPEADWPKDKQPLCAPGSCTCAVSEKIYITSCSEYSDCMLYCGGYWSYGYDCKKYCQSHAAPDAASANSPFATCLNINQWSQCDPPTSVCDAEWLQACSAELSECIGDEASCAETMECWDGDWGENSSVYWLRDLMTPCVLQAGAEARVAFLELLKCRMKACGPKMANGCTADSEADDCADELAVCLAQ
jgi:hypothetical protein